MNKDKPKTTTPAGEQLRQLADVMDLAASANSRELWKRAGEEQLAYEREIADLRRRIEVLERKAAARRSKPAK